MLALVSPDKTVMFATYWELFLSQPPNELPGIVGMLVLPRLVSKNKEVSPVSGLFLWVQQKT